MIELYHHQKVALANIRINPNFALFMSQGTGKTIPSLCRILDLLVSGSIDNALVVAPKSALGAWVRDMEHFDKPDRELLEKSITLINYDKVWRGGEKSEFYRKYGCIILDEAHNIKNRTSQRAKFLLKIACMADYRYILTGTPFGNGQLESIWSLFCFLNPYMERGRVYSRIFQEELEQRAAGTYKGSYKEFLDRYCILDRYHKPASYRNVHELQDIINKYSYRVRKEECLDLPDKLPDEIVSVDMSSKAKGLYKRLCKESAILEYEVLAENPLSRLGKLRQLASGFLKVDPEYIEDKTNLVNGDILQVDCGKLSALSEIIDGFEPDKKLVVFAEFKHSIRLISDYLSRAKIKHVVLDGEQKNKAIWRDFQSDKTIRVIVCQYQTANAGIDLFASDTIIYYEPTLRSTVLEQSRDRIHRPGQTNKCSYIHLITTGTVETAIYRALAGYSDFSDKMFYEYMDNYTRSYST